MYNGKYLKYKSLEQKESVHVLYVDTTMKRMRTNK